MSQIVSHKDAVRAKLKEQDLHQALDHAVHNIHRNRAQCLAEHFPQWEEMRTEAQALKSAAVEHLGALVAQFEAQATKNGIKVHYAQNAADACAIIEQLITEHQITRVIKAKTMVSEEIGLQDYLHEHGHEVEVSDVGDLIVHLNHEHPVHILAPAMHHDRYSIGKIFAQNLHVAEEHEPERLMLIARQHLRTAFEHLQMGISGVNFAAAKEGALWLIENEGNGRMCTTMPDIHVALCGIEKIVPSLHEASTLAQMVPAAGLGQFVPTFNNIILGPRREGELDGPKEVHVILLDNGRAAIAAKPEYRSVLRCLRCSACMNFCPVFKQVGGHAYLTTYPGPIGLALSPQLHNLAQCGHMLTMCSQCKRCAEVCPVKIPLPDLILQLRRHYVEQAAHPDQETVKRMRLLRLTFALFAQMAVSGKLWRNLMKKSYAADFFVQLTGKALLPPAKRWAYGHTLPRLKSTFYRDIAQIEGVEVQ